jgi:hypothetical protein
MLSKEIVEEFFVKIKLHDSQGKIRPLPPEGELVVEKFRSSWVNEELLDGQFPVVSVGPTTLADGVEGYTIRKEIIYLNQFSVPRPNIQ